MARNWGKKYEDVANRISKKGRLAEEGHHLKQVADKKLATESLEEKMVRTGVVNFETGKAVDFKDVPEEIMGFISKEFYENKLVPSIRENEEAKVMDKLQQLIAGMENRIVEKLMGEKVKMAEIELKKLELQVELARLEAAKLTAEPIEFELTPFINPLAGKVQEVVKPTRSRRGKLAGKVEEVVESTGVTEIVDCPVPEKYLTKTGRIGWGRVQADDNLLNVIYDIVKHAHEHGVNVHRGDEFRKFSNMTGAAYQKYMDNTKGIRGAWKALMTEFGF